ncbi:MAG TPA: FAD-binding and (Fe-S)-binding domain-containing protein, partial [Streptosporangiaceae bacterium]|nr:FAD-binding and (Fe-S)-binding domain-containing protein [Streptosporangiaceae bacterium]
AALRRAGVVGVDESLRRRAEYSSDASLYRVMPAVVVFPRDPDEVAAVVDTCRSERVPLTARGGGTSIAGNSVGPGVVLDFSRYLNQIHDIDAASATAVVDPGVVLDDLQVKAAAHGLRFGPEPSTHSRCTIGGMIGNNACGARALGYGRTADNVTELDVVTGTGDRLRVGANGAQPSMPVVSELERLVRSRLGVIRQEFGMFTRQVSGYSLEHLLPERGFHLAAALAGTEGTLAVVCQATLRLVRAPAATALVVLGYSDIAAAADAVPSLLPSRLIALEGLDERIVRIAKRGPGGAAVPELPRGGAWVLAELGGDDRAEVGARADALVREAGGLGGRVVASAAEATALWRIREDGAALSARLGRHGPALSGWEDAAVPPERLGAYLREFEALMTQWDLTGAPYGHFGDGCVHIRIDFPLSRPGGRAVFRGFLTDAARLVASYGGSVSGEHGDGRARSELLPMMYSAQALDTFAAVKGLFDPLDVLNPGVIVRPRPVDADLRLASASIDRDRAGLRYADDGGEFSAAVHRCVGVGKCRVTAASGVMCPSFRATRDEKDSTRGRARVLQELANGSLPGGWRSAEVAEALDLCLSCKACSTECPMGVDMASYKAEVLYQRYRRRLRPGAHYSLGWLPVWVRLASRSPQLVNRVLSGPLAPAAKRIAGVDGRRPFPALPTRTFRQWFARHQAAAGAPLLLWVDTFTNHFTPQVGVAAVAVLEAAGFRVTITERPLCCGLTWVSTGQLGTARKMLARSVAALEVPAKAGVPIVGLEPSCTALFRGDAAELLGRTPAVEAVAKSVRTLAEVLTSADGWQPPAMAGTTAIVQPHCHHRAVLGYSADLALLARAGVDARVVEGCCGLAGNFGAERGHYDLSVAVASNALLPALAGAPSSAIMLADGFSCRTQVDHLAHRTGIHLAELLAASASDHG